MYWWWWRGGVPIKKDSVEWFYRYLYDSLNVICWCCCFPLQYCDTNTKCVFHVIQSAAAHWFMVTSSNGNIFHVISSLWGESTGHGWIPLTKASDAELWFISLICPWTNGLANNRDAGDLRRHRAHYEVTVIYLTMPALTLLVTDKHTHSE